MTESKNNLRISSLTKLVTMNLSMPWFELAGEIWKIGRKVMRGLSNEGMYEVLNYESTQKVYLELRFPEDVFLPASSGDITL